MDFKNTKAENNTITRDMKELSAEVGNVYETLMIVAKRANQISVEMKEELSRKLQDFASVSDNLEEIFENREQIEISKFYERLPKPVLIALQEFTENRVYHRKAEAKTTPTV